LRKISLEHELTSASLGQAEQTIDELRRLLDSRAQKIEDLQREREEAYNIVARETGPQPPRNTRIDAQLGLIYVRAPESQDDLKRISGVADVLEKKLNDLGVYTYKQVMHWDDTAVHAFSELLAFKDRISRENWVEQARLLHAQAHGRAA
jgi:predicted flap endonuclease-1-like 5' DNA nuclease